jgi:hypothetical protein
MASLYALAGHGEESQGISIEQLLELNADWSRPHEGRPMGVPGWFDWALYPRIRAGNRPGKFTAFTGWGQVFWARDTVGNPGPVQIRNFQVFLCHGADRHWVLTQSGGIEGAEFRADFKDNVARAPTSFKVENDISTVTFEAGMTYHFWPSSGRARLPHRPLCGVLVLLEARLLGTANIYPGVEQKGGYLIGVGADYWADLTSVWDQYKTNKDVGVGRLKYVGNNWSWYGMSTATDDDLQRLYDSGLMNSSW